jgi:hypothetical protein
MIAAGRGSGALAGSFLAGRRSADRPIPTFKRLTFRRGYIPTRVSRNGMITLYGTA